MLFSIDLVGLRLQLLNLTLIQLYEYVFSLGI